MCLGENMSTGTLKVHLQVASSMDQLSEVLTFPNLLGIDEGDRPYYRVCQHFHIVIISIRTNLIVQCSLSFTTKHYLNFSQWLFSFSPWYHRSPLISQVAAILLSRQAASRPNCGNSSPPCLRFQLISFKLGFGRLGKFTIINCAIFISFCWQLCISNQDISRGVASGEQIGSLESCWATYL